jgi:hypothetical protein
MLVKLLVAVSLVAAGVGVAATLPDIQRYLKLRAM